MLTDFHVTPRAGTIMVNAWKLVLAWRMMSGGGIAVPTAAQVHNPSPNRKLCRDFSNDPEVDNL
jgi:hypothetical protein